jgi:hypothetical protein
MPDPIQPAPSADDRDAVRVQVRYRRTWLGKRRAVVELSNRTTPEIPPERFTLREFRELCETAAYRLPLEGGGYIVGRQRFTDRQWAAFRDHIHAHVDRVTTLTPVTA